MASDGRRGRNKVRLFRGRVSIAKVNLDVNAGGISKGRFGNPGKK
jgi:hypothetical protein